jgi:plastocyanin
MSAGQHTEQSAALMSRSRPLLATLLGAGALLAACAPGGPPARPAGGRLAVVLDDFSVSPQEIAVRRGSLVLDVSNVGRLGHNLVLERGPQELASMKTLKPGQHGTLTLHLRRRGAYRLVCSLANHEELGQYATITVR